MGRFPAHSGSERGAASISFGGPEDSLTLGAQRV
jgi:hypothetical protein